jgi:hypothetical protein
MGLLNLLAAGAALKVEPSKTAEIRMRATEKVTWSGEARIELFSRFVIESLFWIRSVAFCRRPIRRTCATFPGGHFRENRLPMSRFSSQISPHRAMAWDRAAPLARSGDANQLSSVARRYATRSPNVSGLRESDASSATALQASLLLHFGREETPVPTPSGLPSPADTRCRRKKGKGLRTRLPANRG